MCEAAPPEPGMKNKELKIGRLCDVQNARLSTYFKALQCSLAEVLATSAAYLTQKLVVTSGLDYIRLRTSGTYISIPATALRQHFPQ